MGKQKSDILSGMGSGFSIIKALRDAGANDEELRQIIMENSLFPQKIVALLKGAGKNTEPTTYFIPVIDADVPERHQPTLAKYRRLATEWGVPTTAAVCYRVRPGFTLKSHAPKFGPCYEQFKYLQDWNFPDEPTKECLVFWIPRLVPTSTGKTHGEQIQLLGEIRQQLELPEHHLSELGKVALVAGLILAHYKATNERVPLDRYWIRTDTCYADGHRLDLGGFDGTGLRCGFWDFGEGRRGGLGVFALGVEELGI